MNRKRLRFALRAAATLLLFTELLFAHHGNAGFDMSRIITVTGTITRVEIVNPHAVVYIDVVKNDKGTVENWALSGSGPNVLAANGLKGLLKPGLVVTATGYLPRNGQNYDLESKLASSQGAMARLRSGHLLQVGGIRFGNGPELVYGMGPRSSLQ